VEGWYPDSRDPSLYRWWDGQSWVAVQRVPPGSGVPPLAPYLPDARPYRRDSTSAAASWVVACAPLIGVGACIAAAVTRNVVLGLVAAAVSVPGVWLVAFAAAAVDTHQLRAADWPTQLYRASLGPCCYLLFRAVSRRGVAPKVGWSQLVVAVLLTVASGFLMYYVIEGTTQTSRQHSERATVEQPVLIRLYTVGRGPYSVDYLKLGWMVAEGSQAGRLVRVVA
jgi:hypothetical protein